jgi:hypothetical protein
MRSSLYYQLGLDMAVLLRTLVPAGQIQEADTPWTFDSLLRVLTYHTGLYNIVNYLMN